MNTLKFQTKENRSRLERQKMVEAIVSNRMPFCDVIVGVRLSACLDQKSAKALPKDVCRRRVDALAVIQNPARELCTVFVDGSRLSRDAFLSIAVPLKEYGVPVIDLDTDPVFALFYGSRERVANGNKDSAEPNSLARCPHCQAGYYYVIPEDPTVVHQGMSVLCSGVVEKGDEASPNCVGLDHPVNKYGMHVDAEVRDIWRNIGLQAVMHRAVMNNKPLFVSKAAVGRSRSS